MPLIELGCVSGRTRTLSNFSSLYILRLKTSAVRSMISSKLIFVRYVGCCGCCVTCSLCQTVWTRGLPTRDSSSITGLVLDKSFPQSLYYHGVILKDHETDSTGTSILIPLLLLNFNMRLYGNPTAWYLFFCYSSNVEWSKCKKKNIRVFVPHAFKTHASPYTGMSGTVFLRRRLA